MSSLQEWFGFDRRERRASLMLIVLIIIILSVKFLIPERKIPLEYYVLASSAEKGNAKDGGYFDPDTSSYNDMIKAGLSPEEANKIIRYREKGGRFRKPGEIRVISAPDTADMSAVIPYISKGHEAGKGREMTEINSATQEELEKLPGIGKVLAARIIRYRNLLGGYAGPSQLTEVYGINDSLAVVLQEYVVADTILIRKVRINTAAVGELARHPYIGKVNAETIEALRQQGLRFNSLKELLDAGGIETRNPMILRYYLDFSK